MKNTLWLRQLTRWLLVVLLAVSLVSCWPSKLDTKLDTVNANPGADMDNVKVNITISDAHLEQMDQVTEDLKAAGLDVEQTLSTLGIVTGSIDSEKVSALSDVTGVDSVETDKKVTIPKTGPDVQ